MAMTHTRRRRPLKLNALQLSLCALAVVVAVLAATGAAAGLLDGLN